MSLREQLDTLTQQVGEIHAEVFGTGPGRRAKDGLAFRVEQHAKFVDFWERFWWAVLLAIITIPAGVAVTVICAFILPHANGG